MLSQAFVCHPTRSTCVLTSKYISLSAPYFQTAPFQYCLQARTSTYPMTRYQLKTVQSRNQTRALKITANRSLINQSHLTSCVSVNQVQQLTASLKSYKIAFTSQRKLQNVSWASNCSTKLCFNILQQQKEQTHGLTITLVVVVLLGVPARIVLVAVTISTCST